jgi:ABC-2 type transport system permease protein
MDLYRMFRMKSFYVIGIILAAATFFTTSMSVLDYNMMKEEAGQNSQVYEQETSSDEEPVNLGMDVTIPTRPGEMVTVYDQVYANLHGKFIALFMVIFAVLFSASDLSSGYIKNIGGQMKNRGNLILSKAVALFIYTVLTMLFYLCIQTVAQAVCFHELQLGSLRDLAVYSAIQILLHYVLLLICMAITIITRSKVFSMAFAVLFCMNVMVILYSTVDKILARFGIEDFNMLQYTVTGRMALLEMAPSAGGCVKALTVAVVFGLAVLALSSQIFRKRDI